MTTLFLTHPDCADHDPGYGHPEAPGRLGAIWRALEEPEFSGLLRLQAPLGTQADIERVHQPSLVTSVMARVPQNGHVALDADTILSRGSAKAALRAVGAVTAAIDALVAGTAQNAFCAIRPPGHHAEPTHVMGFCLFNAIAIGARHAQSVHGLGRVAIVDFDVHHGNGTQTVAEKDPTLFFASTHQYPHYPGTGSIAQTGVGNVVNVPLPAGTTGPVFRRAFESRILPALDGFAPDLILVSAGFDAHRADPLGGLELEEDDFAWVTSRLVEIAALHCHGRLVSALEGGYDLRALAGSASAHVSALMAKPC